MTMLAANIRGFWIHLKLLWFVLAYGLASGSLLPSPGALVQPARPAAQPGDGAAAIRS
jgi:hypothetical protein